MSIIGLKHIQVTIEDCSYPFYFGYDCLDEIVRLENTDIPDKIFLICDKKIFPIFGERVIQRLNIKCPVITYCHESVESEKNIETVSGLLNKLISSGASRQSMVISLGGGITGNVAGMVAGLLFRGIRLAHIPTTLLSALDSVISLKQGVNSVHGKNHFGLFHPPEFVFCDVSFFKTLPNREIKSALAEIIKNTLSVAPDSLSRLYPLLSVCSESNPSVFMELLELGVQVKVELMKNDKKEKRSAIVFEYGHTIGHAIEHLYSSSLTHGECVGLGMLCEGWISRKLCGLEEDELALHQQLLDLAQLPIHTNGLLDIPKVVDCVFKDNKRGYLLLGEDEVAMVLLKKLGFPDTQGGIPLTCVPKHLVLEALEYLESLVPLAEMTAAA